MPDAPTFEIEVSQTIIQNGIEVQTGPTYTVQMQLGTGPQGPQGIQGVPGQDGADGADGRDGTGTMNGPASATDGHLAVFDGTDGTKIKDGGAVPTLSSLGGVGTARKVSAGAGLTGGGDLTADRTFAADFGTASGKIAQGNDSRFVGVGITDQSSAYTLATADAGTVIRSTASSAITITVPASTFSSGQIVEILQYGAGQVTVAAGSGVTLRLAAAGLKTKAQYSSLSILFLSATEAVVSGDGSA